MEPFLDTSVLIRFQKHFRKLRELGQVKIPVISVAEFARGIHETQNPRLRNRAERFLSRQIASMPVVEFDFESARSWAILIKALKDAGQTMKFGDSLIAAQCLAHNTAVVTADDDFERVPGLQVIRL
jgi:predicted nucleic acid-binding protein